MELDLKQRHPDNYHMQGCRDARGQIPPPPIRREYPRQVSVVLGRKVTTTNYFVRQFAQCLLFLGRSSCLIQALVPQANFPLVKAGKSTGTWRTRATGGSKANIAALSYAKSPEHKSRLHGLDLPDACPCEVDTRTTAAQAIANPTNYTRSDEAHCCRRDSSDRLTCPICTPPTVPPFQYILLKTFPAPSSPTDCGSTTMTASLTSFLYPFAQKIMFSSIK